MPAPIIAFRADIPIGQTADGRDVIASPAFLNYIAVQLYARVGGAVSPPIANTDNLDALQDELSLGPVFIAPAVNEQIGEPLLHARVTELFKRVDDLEKGNV